VDGLGNRWFLDPIFRGSYPEDIVAFLGEDAPTVEPGDLDAIAAPIDFLGINNYFREVVEAGETPEHPHIVRDASWDFTDMGWEIYPDGLFDLLQRVHDDYTPPSIYITENGAAFADNRAHDGAVRDPERT